MLCGDLGLTDPVGIALRGGFLVKKGKFHEKNNTFNSLAPGIIFGGEYKRSDWPHWKDFDSDWVKNQMM